MYNPLKVSLENIIPLTEARDHFSQIVSEVQKDKLYVLTKGGKPAVAIVDVKYLEHITGGEVKQEQVDEAIKKAPEKVGLPTMIEHPSTDSKNSPQAGSGQVPPKPLSEVQPKPIPEPAGFAAPQPPKPQPKADRPWNETPPPPPIAPPPTNPTPPAPSKPEPPKTEPSQAAPLKTPPIGENINIQFAPDQSDLDEKAKDAQLSEEEKAVPDDENPPAQYAGEDDTTKEPEPDDMGID